jgi:hypothetical protein
MLRFYNAMANGNIWIMEDLAQYAVQPFIPWNTIIAFIVMCVVFYIGLDNGDDR